MKELRERLKETIIEDDSWKQDALVVSKRTTKSIFALYKS
jgi:hypothetical protein